MANNDLNTNPLYKDISTTAQEIRDLRTNQPTFESNVRSGLVSNDNTLNTARDGYTDKVAELFAHDKEMSSSYGNPESESYIENPYARSKAGANLYAQKGKEVASALGIYKKREDLLGDLVEKATRVYEAGIAGKETEYKTESDRLDRAWDKYKFGVETSLKRNSGSNITGNKEVDAMTESQVQSAFEKTFGNKAYGNLSKTIGERNTAARGILAKINAGEKINTTLFMNDRQRKGRETLEELVIQAESAENVFSNPNASGTGYFEGRLPDTWITDPNKVSSRSAATLISADKIKEISGVAVSNQEYIRLQAALPSKLFSEAVNLQKIQELRQLLEIGRDLQDIAMLNNIDINEASAKYGKEVYELYGVPYYLYGNSQTTKPSLDSLLEGD